MITPLERTIKMEDVDAPQRKLLEQKVDTGLLETSGDGETSIRLERGFTPRVRHQVMKLYQDNGWTVRETGDQREGIEWHIKPKE